MKTTSGLKNYVIFFLFIMLATGSCKKISSDPEPTPASAYRVTEVILYNNDTLSWKEVFTYNGNQITEIMYYENLYKSASPDAKHVIEYSSGKPTKYIYYYINNNQWIKKGQTEILDYAGSRPTGVLFTNYDNGTIVNQDKELYVFVNDRISEKTYSFSNGGTWYNSGRYTYSYNSSGQLQVEQSYSGQGNPGSQQLYTWEGALLKEEIHKHSDGTNGSKTVNEYSNNLLSKENYYYWENNSWIFENEYTTALYNANNCLTEINYVSDTYNQKIVISYEPLQGNYRELAGAFWEYNFWPGNPEPVPVKSASGDKSLFGNRHHSIKIQ